MTDDEQKRLTDEELQREYAEREAQRDATAAELRRRAEAKAAKQKAEQDAADREFLAAWKQLEAQLREGAKRAEEDLQVAVQAGDIGRAFAQYVEIRAARVGIRHLRDELQAAVHRTGADVIVPDLRYYEEKFSNYFEPAAEWAANIRGEELAQQLIKQHQADNG